MNIERLKELAEKATPGPWYSKWYGGPSWELATDYENMPIACTGEYSHPNRPTGEYIAAANPKAILELIAKLDRYEEALKLAAETLDIPAHNLHSCDCDVMESECCYCLYRKVAHACRTAISQESES